jgi:hypothetical protein
VPALLLMPPSRAAVLPLTLESCSSSLSSTLKMPPPEPAEAVLPLIVLSTPCETVAL